MTLNDLCPRFQGNDIFEAEYRKKRNFVLKTNLLLQNRKLYLMVLCLVTLTDI